MKDDNWMPQIDRTRCNGCGDCIAGCAPHALAGANGTAVLAAPSACTYCGDCERICHTGAVTLPYQIILAPAEDS